MKNVKVILIGVALCATVFANARIEALGGDATFWSGDRANAEFFPGALNDGNWLELGGVEGDPTASINWGDDAKWGFNFDSAGDHNWVDMSWAKNGMGLSIGFASESAAFGWDAECSDGTSADETACTDAEGDWTPGYEGADYSGFDLAWGKTMGFGDLGAGYKSLTEGDGGAETEMWVNWRGSMNIWVFDSAKANFSMTDDGDGTTGMNLGFDMFTHVTPADGVDILFGLGFDHSSTSIAAITNSATYTAFVEGVEGVEGADAVAASCTTGDDGAGGAWDGTEANCTDGYDAGSDAVEEVIAVEEVPEACDGSDGWTTGAATCDNSVAQIDGSSMTLPAAIIAVEAALADWATVRAFVTQDHQLSCDDDGTDCGIGNFTRAGFGVGFGWQAANGSSINLDMEVSNQLFVDPISTMAGWEAEDLATGAVTLSYTF